MFDGPTLIAIAATFVVGGTVKGVIGLGLPAVAVGLLTVVIGLPQAMALLLIPSFVTNLWQAFDGGNSRAVFARIWPFLLLATITVWPGTWALTRIDISLLSGLLGVLLVAYAALSFVGLRLSIPRSKETAVGVVIGAINGVLSGMTGAFNFPSVLYLQALGLPRDMLIQAMGMLFTLSTVALGLSLGAGSLLSWELGALSAAALIPSFAGLLAGRFVRRRLSESVFRRVFFVALALLGTYIIATALRGLPA